ncbi:MAG: hypothetical protein IJ733_16350 [Lachnospiraceae bacterium]|nr:hypothetical protein [Lachnospiraceae bacterium]
MLYKMCDYSWALLYERIRRKENIGKMKKYKKTILLSAGIFLILALIAIVFIYAMADKYVAYVNLPGNEYQDIHVNVRGESSCDVTELKREGRELVLLLENGKKERWS